MIQSSENMSSKQKSNWRGKLWRSTSPQSPRSSPARTSVLKTPKSSPRIPSLSSSPTSTPGSQKHEKSDNQLFLTPLDVLDGEHEVNSLLENQIGILFGDWNIPPPPPRKLINTGLSKPQLLPSKPISGPKIKPYFTNSPKFDAFTNRETCFICKDVLETKLDSERLVQLDCGDCVHGECLKANVEMLLEAYLKTYGSSELTCEEDVKKVVFPNCEGRCCSSEKTSASVVPLEKDFISDLMTEVMLSVKLMKVSPQTTKHPKATPLIFGSENRTSRYFFKDNQSLRPMSNYDISSQHSQTIMTETTHPIYGSLFNDSKDEQSTRSLEEVKNIFIKHMLNKHANFNLVILVSLGSLRLVDKLLVAFEDNKFTLQIVYLFSNFLVIEAEGPSPILFPLDEEHTITTPEISVIQFVKRDGQIPVMKLHSKIDAVIEKWGIALSDHSLLLPSDVITSSLNVEDLLQEEPSKTFQRQAIEFPSSRKHASFRRLNSRISTVSIIEPREIWSERSDGFESELMKIGVIPAAVSETDDNDAEPTSPLNIIRMHDTTTSVPFVEGKLSDGSDSDYDSDSDSELINEVMHKRKL